MKLWLFYILSLSGSHITQDWEHQLFPRKTGNTSETVSKDGVFVLKWFRECKVKEVPATLQINLKSSIPEGTYVKCLWVYRRWFEFSSLIIASNRQTIWGSWRLSPLPKKPCVKCHIHNPQNASWGMLAARHLIHIHGMAHRRDRIWICAGQPTLERRSP